VSGGSAALEVDDGVKPASLRQRLPSGRRSLVARLVVTFLLLSVVMLAIVGVVSYQQARSALEDSAFARLDTAADQKADSLDRWIDEQRRNVVFTAGLLGGYTGSSTSLEGPARELLAEDVTSGVRLGAQQAAVDILRYAVSQTSDAEEFLVADLDGTIVASTAAEHEGVSQATQSSQRSSTSSASTGSSCNGPASATRARRTSSVRTGDTCTPRSWPTRPLRRRASIVRSQPRTEAVSTTITAASR
jgi:hypothetical protein